MNNPTITLEIRYGSFCEKSKAIALPISDELLRELKEPLEYDFGKLPVFPGICNQSCIEAKKRLFKMRRNFAEEITKSVVKALVDDFGSDDTLFGYKISDMDESEKEYHRQRGRLNLNR